MVPVAAPPTHEEPLAGGATLEDLYREHRWSLVRLASLLLHDPADAEEVMQDAFVRLLERWPAVQAAGNPEGYLYRTAMNVFRSRLRRAAVAVRRAFGQLPADDQMAEVEARDSVVRALAPLPTRQRAAVVLMDVLGLSSEQAGSALGIQAVTVRVLAARGRATLREALDEDR